MSWVVVSLPAAPGYDGQAALASVFGQVPRIFLASIAAFWAGEIANAAVMSRMKLWTGGRMLWTRTIGSTVVGAGRRQPDLLPAGYSSAQWQTSLVVQVLRLTNYALKALWEVLLTPLILPHRSPGSSARKASMSWVVGTRLPAFLDEGLTHGQRSAGRWREQAAEPSRCQVTVVILSVALGLCNIKDGNIVQAMAPGKADSVHTCGEYQATRMKLHIDETAAAQLAVLGSGRTIGVRAGRVVGQGVDKYLIF